MVMEMIQKEMNNQQMNGKLEPVKPEFGAGFLFVVIMFAFDYLGEQSIVNAWIGFAIRMAGWG